MVPVSRDPFQQRADERLLRRLSLAATSLTALTVGSGVAFTGPASTHGAAYATLGAVGALAAAAVWAERLGGAWWLAGISTVGCALAIHWSGVYAAWPFFFLIPHFVLLQYLVMVTSTTAAFGPDLAADFPGSAGMRVTKRS